MESFDVLRAVHSSLQEAPELKEEEAVLFPAPPSKKRVRREVSNKKAESGQAPPPKKRYIWDEHDHQLFLSGIFEFALKSIR